MKKFGLLLAVSWILLAGLPAHAQQSQNTPPTAPYRYWPKFPRPHTVLTIKSVPSEEMTVVLQTLAGLAARACQRGQADEMIWVPLDIPPYRRYFTMMVKQTGAQMKGPFEIWDLVRHFQAKGIVKGYSLYQKDTSSHDLYAPPAPKDLDVSLNIATSLCASTGALPITAAMEPIARRYGLRRLFDARTMTEEQCWAQYRKRFSTRVLAGVDPKTAQMRQECVADQAFVLSHPGRLYEKVLSRMQPDSPFMGWLIGNELELTLPSSHWGSFQTATNWCSNLPLLSTEIPGKTFPAKKLMRPKSPALWDLPWEDNVHYATFVMSDGDNVAWMMSSFLMPEGRNWWASRMRGSVPIGWPVCFADLAQVSPYTLDYLFQTATARDDFMLAAGGYYYPDVFGSARSGQDVLKRHAARMNGYMNLGGLNILLQNWDSPAALNAYKTYVQQMPGLQGIFTIQYSPYTAGSGSIVWIPDGHGAETPVVSIQQALWSHGGFPEAGGPREVAEKLNGLTHQGTPTDQRFYSTVIVHAWSWFKKPHTGDAAGADEVDPAQGGKPGAAGGLAAEKWCLDRLQSYVRVVTPTQLIGLLRLRMHPRSTLQAGLHGLDAECKWMSAQPWAKTKQGRAMMPQIRAALKVSHQAFVQGDYQSSFDTGKRVAQALQSRS